MGEDVVEVGQPVGDLVGLSLGICVGRNDGYPICKFVGEDERFER